MNETLLIGLVSLCLVLVSVNSAIAVDKHYSEMKMLYAEIEFDDPSGSTLVDETGITYYYKGNVDHDPNLVYPEKYYGTYPLYFPTSIVPTKITVTNYGPWAIAKHMIVTEVHVINLDGSLGTTLISPDVFKFEVALGETVTIFGTFTLPPVGKSPDSLNLVTVSIYHHRNDNNDASLIMTKDAVFCPPAYLEDSGY
jgi:hypothetical protein